MGRIVSCRRRSAKTGGHPLALVHAICMQGLKIGTAFHIDREITLNFYVVPSNYLYPTAETVSVNGSLPNGNCSIASDIGARFKNQSRCEDPTSSVLFDGNIPTLTGLDGNIWASQLLPLQLHNPWPDRRDIIFDFRSTPNYTGVELVMFNCPEWGIAVEVIEVQGATSLGGTTTLRGSFHPTNTSCDSLMRVCIISSVLNSEKVTILQFTPATGSNRTYLAEVRFYGDSAACSPDTITPPDTATSPSLDIPAPQPPEGNNTLSVSRSSSTIVIAASIG